METFLIKEHNRTLKKILLTKITNSLKHKKIAMNNSSCMRTLHHTFITVKHQQYTYTH